MADVEFLDFSVKVKGAIEDEIIAYLYEAAGDLEAAAVDFSTPGKSYGGKGGIQARNLWEYAVDEKEKVAVVGSKHEAAYWEELGTGEYALDRSKSRKGWWVYVEGQPSRGGGKSYATKEEADETVAYLRSKGLDAHSTNGSEPKRPLYKSFNSQKNALVKRAEEVLKGLD